MADKSVLYVKDGCPYCMKVLVYLAETGQLGNVALVDESDENRKLIAEKSGRPASFPCLQRGDGFCFETDKIIAKFEQESGKPIQETIVYKKYADGIFQGYINMIKYIGDEDASKVVKGLKEELQNFQG